MEKREIRFEVLESGHVYRFDNMDLDGKGEADASQTIKFVNRESELRGHPGIQTQDMIRVLLDRTMHCDNCIPACENDMIIYGLRVALLFHEIRALRRKLEKGELKPELVVLGPDGHFKLETVIAMSPDQIKFEEGRKAEDEAPNR